VPPLNPRAVNPVEGLTPLLRIERERGLEKFRTVFGVEKVRVGVDKVLVGVDKFRDRNVFADPERNVFGVDRVRERNVFALNRFIFVVLNRFTLERLERLVTKFLFVPDLTKFLLVPDLTKLLNAAAFQGLLP